MSKTRKHVLLSDDSIYKLEAYMIDNNLNPKKFSQAIEIAIENLCVEDKSNSSFDIEKKLNAIAKDIRLGNIAALRAYHNLNVDVEDMSFDINNTQLEFLAKIDFDNELKKKQTKVSETRKVQQPIMKNKNPLFDRS